MNNKASSTGSLKEVTKANPCVICGKPDYCSRLDSGLILCKRTDYENLPSGYAKTSKQDSEGTYYIGTEESQRKWNESNKNGFKSKYPDRKPDYEYVYPTYLRTDNEEEGIETPLGLLKRSQTNLLVCRWNAPMSWTNDSKDIRQRTRTGNKVEYKVNLPKDSIIGLYSNYDFDRALEDYRIFKACKAIIIVEGEKGVDCFDKIDPILRHFFAITNPGGACKWTNEQLALLAHIANSRDIPIIISPDHDKLGFKNGKQIYDGLLSNGIPKERISVVDHSKMLENPPLKFDMADYISNYGFIFKTVQEFIDTLTVTPNEYPWDKFKEEIKEKSEGRYQIRIAKETIESKGIDTSINWLVDSLLAANSSTLLVAQEKTGKTCLMLDMLAAIRTGKEFLGKATKQSKVLFINTDSSEATFLKQVNDRWGNDEELDNQLPYVQDWIADETGLQFLEDYCKANPGSVIVIDSIKGLSYPLDIDENTPAIGKIVKEISSKICSNGCSVVFLHHVSKAKGKYRTHKGTGHHSISSNVDQILLLEDLPNNKNEVRRLSSLGSRFTRKFSIDYLPTDDYRCEVTFQANTNDDEEDDNDSIKGQLLTYLVDKDDWVTRKEILDELGTEDKYLSRILKQLGEQIQVKPDPSDSRKKLYKIGGQKKVSSPDSPTET